MPTPDEAVEEAGRPRAALRSASPWVIAGVVTAASSFVALIVAARALSPEDNARFLVFWSALFAITGSLSAVQGEASRAMADADDEHPEGAPLLGVTLALGVLLALGVFASGLFWLPPLLNTGTGDAAATMVALALISLAVVIYAGQSAAVGGLIALREANPASTIVGVEGVGRLVLMAVAAVTVMGATAFEVAAVLPMALWTLVLVGFGTLRRIARLRVRETSARFLRNCLYAVAAGAGTSLLVNGYAAFLKATSPDVEPAALARTILAVTLTRAPLLMPLLSFQGLLVSYLVRNGAHLRATLLRLGGLLWGGVLVVAAGMWLLGPWVMRTFYGPAYETHGLFLASVTVGAGCTATLVVAAAAALAQGLHRLYLLSWVVGTASSLTLLLVPGPLEARVLISLVVGPLCGAVVALLGVRKLSPSPARP